MRKNAAETVPVGDGTSFATDADLFIGQRSGSCAESAKAHGCAAGVRVASCQQGHSDRSSVRNCATLKGRKCRILAETRCKPNFVTALPWHSVPGVLALEVPSATVGFISWHTQDIDINASKTGEQLVVVPSEALDRCNEDAEVCWEGNSFDQ